MRKQRRIRGALERTKPRVRKYPKAGDYVLMHMGQVGIVRESLGPNYGLIHYYDYSKAEGDISGQYVEIEVGRPVTEKRRMNFLTEGIWADRVFAEVFQWCDYTHRLDKNVYGTEWQTRIKDMFCSQYLPYEMTVLTGVTCPNGQVRYICAEFGRYQFWHFDYSGIRRLFRLTSENIECSL